MLCSRIKVKSLLPGHSLSLEHYTFQVCLCCLSLTHSLNNCYLSLSYTPVFTACAFNRFNVNAYITACASAFPTLVSYCCAFSLVCRPSSHSYLSHPITSSVIYDSVHYSLSMHDAPKSSDLTKLERFTCTCVCGLDLAKLEHVADAYVSCKIHSESLLSHESAGHFSRNTSFPLGNIGSLHVGRSTIDGFSTNTYVTSRIIVDTVDTKPFYRSRFVISKSPPTYNTHNNHGISTANSHRWHGINIGNGKTIIANHCKINAPPRIVLMTQPSSFPVVLQLFRVLRCAFVRLLQTIYLM